jgi:hypothetical protein
MRFVRKAPVAPQQPVPPALKKRVYTDEEVAARNKQKVELRRRNEDRRKEDAA